MMAPHDDRSKIEGVLQWLHPDNPDIKLTPDKIQIILTKLGIQVLLDIRDTVYQIAQHQGVQKWGPKIAVDPQPSAPKAPVPEHPEVTVL
jgi:hypothetical protein